MKEPINWEADPETFYWYQEKLKAYEEKLVQRAKKRFLQKCLSIVEGKKESK